MSEFEDILEDLGISDEEAFEELRITKDQVTEELLDVLAELGVYLGKVTDDEVADLMGNQLGIYLFKIVLEMTKISLAVEIAEANLSGSPTWDDQPEDEVAADA